MIQAAASNASDQLVSAADPRNNGGEESHHESRRADLAPPRDVDATGAHCAENQHGHRHDHLTGQNGQSEPEGDRAVDDHREHSYEEQESIRGRVEELADLRYLSKSAGQVAIHPIGDPEYGQEKRSGESILLHEQQDQEYRNAEQANDRDEVRDGEQASVLLL